MPSRLSISERATPVVPLAVQPVEDRAVPLGVRPESPVGPEAPEMRRQDNHQAVPLGVQPVVFDCCLANLKAQETTKKSHHLAVPLGVQPVVLARDDADGAVPLGVQSPRHMDMNPVPEVNMETEMNNMLMMNLVAKVNLQISMNLLARVNPVAKEHGRIRQKAREKGRNKAKPP